MKESFMNKIAIVLLLIFAASCAPKKTSKIDYSVPPKNKKELIARVNSKSISSDWLFLKGKTSLDIAEQNFSFNIAIKSRKDSAIWASISAPFGIELFRTLLTKDSVFYLNRTNKTFFKKPISYINDVVKANISFNQIQDIIYATPSILKKNYNFKTNDDNYILEAKDLSYIISNAYRVKEVTIQNKGNYLNYSYNGSYEDLNFPKEVSFLANTSSKSKFQLLIDYTKVVFNKKQNFTFNISNSYEEQE